MATKNATLTTTDWQDVETITDIVLANGNSYTLTIHDASAFWSVSNYLVIQID